MDKYIKKFEKEYEKYYPDIYEPERIRTYNQFVINELTDRKMITGREEKKSIDGECPLLMLNCLPFCKDYVPKLYDNWKKLLKGFIQGNINKIIEREIINCEFESMRDNNFKMNKLAIDMERVEKEIKVNEHFQSFCDTSKDLILRKEDRKEQMNRMKNVNLDAVQETDYYKKLTNMYATLISICYTIKHIKTANSKTICMKSYLDLRSWMKNPKLKDFNKIWISLNPTYMEIFGFTYDEFREKFIDIKLLNQ